jgi:hypothetical protein
LAAAQRSGAPGAGGGACSVPQLALPLQSLELKKVAAAKTVSGSVGAQGAATSTPSTPGARVVHTPSGSVAVSTGALAQVGAAAALGGSSRKRDSVRLAPGAQAEGRRP